MSRLITVVDDEPDILELVRLHLKRAGHLERIADHATNISEDVIYLVKGKSIKHHCETRDFSQTGTREIE